MSQTKLETFRSAVLKGQRIPSDIRQLFLSEDGASDLLEELEVRFLEPGEKPALMSHDYLTAEEREDKDIMANIAAINDVFALITFIAEGADEQLIGYWHGPEGTEITASPIVTYDSEGMFSLLAGETFVEAVLGDYFLDEEEAFEDARQEVEQLGIPIGAESPEGLKVPEPDTDPDELHDQLYEKYRKEAGLT